MNKIEKYSEKVFEDVKHIDEYGNEYWYARELQVILNYKEWRKFNSVIEKAKNACETAYFRPQTILSKPTKWSI